MSSRYINRKRSINNHPSYSRQFNRRGLNYIKQFNTPELSYPTAEQISRLSIIGHVWAVGDRLYKLAYEHYGDPSFWWVIAWYNQVALEGDIILGDVVEIPFPLEQVLRFFEV